MKVEKRYEYLTKDGKKLTNWFSISSESTEVDAKKFIKNYKKNSVNSKLQIKEEFRVKNN